MGLANTCNLSTPEAETRGSQMTAWYIGKRCVYYLVICINHITTNCRQCVACTWTLIYTNQMKEIIHYFHVNLNLDLRWQLQRMDDLRKVPMH